VNTTTADLASEQSPINLKTAFALRFSFSSPDGLLNSRRSRFSGSPASLRRETEQAFFSNFIFNFIFACEISHLAPEIRSSLRAAVYG
jgi:hypothetical protein